MDHEKVKQTIVEQAKQKGMTKAEMQVLSTDPFFVGNQTDYTSAQWVAPLWDRMMAKRKKPLHLRGFHYWIQSQGIKKPDGEKYAHKDAAKDWKFLLRAAQLARYLGIGEWNNLIDLKHPDPVDYNSYEVGSGLERDGQANIQELLEGNINNLVDTLVKSVLKETPKYRTDSMQTWHTEVWCEKNSMGFVIEPACKKFGACYQPLVGQSSVEKVEMAARRALEAARAGKKVRIFYISDFDRYGWWMVTAVARKLEFFVFNEHVDIKLTRLALNEDHIEKFQLPKAPKLGEAVVELDALEAIHPGALAGIVKEALEPYYDDESVNILEQENYRMRLAAEKLVNEKMREPLKKALEGINVKGIATEVDLTQVISDTFVPPEPGHDVEESPDGWVLDTTLDYWTQHDKYNQYKGARVEEEA